MLCTHAFALAQPYYCQRCSHTLAFGASELRSRREERETLNSEVARVFEDQRAVMSLQVDVSIATVRVARKRELLQARRQKVAQLQQALDAQRARVRALREEMARQAAASLEHDDRCADVDHLRVCCVCGTGWSSAANGGWLVRGYAPSSCVGCMRARRSS